VDRESAVHQFRGQEPAEIVRGETGGKEAGCCSASSPQRRFSMFTTVVSRDDLVLRADLALEQ
jgi:hypothetical protein